ncbi:MAG: FIST N-terminal domain-containing protein, partial [Azonexus sp.]|nr:FIST N-terminal domain-containing protein [Azonexus sp.]
MRVKQVVCRKAGELAARLVELQVISPDLLLVFGAVEHFVAAPLHQTLRQAFPDVHLLGCTTAGEI